ncbi:MAG: AAA-like domain-containing protein [Rivularia sp. (in: cyanobacteria)]
MTATNSNFYQVGASLPIDAPSYVQRQADEEFYQKLQAGKFCYVLNSRQMGKSSLRVQTMQRLQKEGTVCAAIDLTGIGNVNQQQWYGGIVYNLSESCQLEDKFDFDWQEWWQKHQTVLSPVQCLNLFIEKVLLAKIKQPIVIFVDEIDKVLSQDFSLDDFFGLIRFFQNQRVDNPIFQRLTFALLGVATPGDLIQNKTQTPFNIGEAIELYGFQIDEVEPLIEGLRGRFDSPQKVMNEILDWTGGQPFLTQKLCKFMVEESAASRKSKVKSQKSKVDEDYSVLVREVVNKRIIENWESQDDPEHLRTIRDRILSSEQRAGYLLELYQQIKQQGQVAAKKNLESSELRLSGLVVQREGKLKVYNRVYQQVFNQNWVETQLKNLRPYSEAFRFWVASGYSDESRLLQGKALVDAEEWAKEKNLGYEDKQFLAAMLESTNPSKSENLQTQVFAFLVKANLLTNQENNKQQAIKAYTEAYNILKNHPEKTNPFTKNQILTTEDIESVHRGLLNLQPNRDRDVWNSLKKHFYARLKNSLKSKDWRVADLTTYRLMLFIADREEARFLDIPQIEKFSCEELKKIDNLWVDNSGGNFGFSVQKEIFVKTGNRLGVKPSDWKDSDYKNYSRFANAVGWYNDKNKNERESGGSYDDFLKIVLDDPKKVRGYLPRTRRDHLGFLFSTCKL